MNIFRLSLLLVLAACESNPPMQDTGPVGLYQEERNITVEMESEDTVCVTEDGQRTCVPVVHDTGRTGEGDS